MKVLRSRSKSLIGVAVLCASVLSGCGLPVEGSYPTKRKGEDPVYSKSDADFEANRKTIFGPGGLSLGGPDKPRDEGGGSGIGVNSFLWRASLDTISFMPVNSADPFGGVIITDWHSDAQAPAERFKLNVYIMGRALRADGVRVAVFRQVQDTRGTWRDSPVPDDASTDVENSILTKARQLRNESLQR
ncbi:MAG: DUF3576 domain-containing protein [Rhodospirillales bacterium]|jgi:hypothetical protein|nr:DUF3576 domain-containing protein [Rhodospirillales bacterium]